MSEDFKNKFKNRSKDFTRSCLLTLPVVASFIINLMRKSLQVNLNHLSEFLTIKIISKQAFSAARLKLRPEAFIELNQTLIDEFYTDNEYKTLFDRRIIAVDGSTLQLPKSQEIIDKYGVCKSQGASMPMARISYAYDVLNDLTIDAIIAPFNSAERHMAVQHVKNISEINSSKRIQDLYIEDRGYPSVPLFFFYAQMNKDFLIRCTPLFINEVRQAIRDNSKDNIVTLSAKKLNSDQKAELRKFVPNMDWNREIQLRILIIPLANGESEILVTTLCDQLKYRYEMFKEFYFMRWGTEENYKFHKCRAEIENFSGISVTAIKQDFYATIFTANVRSLIAAEAFEELQKEGLNKTKKYEYKINKNVSLGSLKDKIIKALLSPNVNLEDFCSELKEQMKKSIIPTKPNRKYLRRREGNKKYPMNSRKSL